MSHTENERGCYCGLWEKSPEVLIQQGIPQGFCGVCDICKKPGHTRHFPGASPVTGSWCDLHFRLVSIVHPLGVYGKYFWGTLILGGLLLHHFLAR